MINSPPPDVIGVAFAAPQPERLHPLLIDTLGAEPQPVQELNLDCARNRFGVGLQTDVLIHPFQLGQERIELIQCLWAIPTPAQPPGPSNSLWFQHIAIVVRDLEQAAQAIAPWVTPISTSPQILPSGVGAFKFRDCVGHAMELLWFPQGQGDPRWHEPTAPLFQGIDHSAICISDSDASLQYYLGDHALELRYASFNQGVEQDRLDGLEGTKVAIHGVGGRSGMGIEFLRYICPAAMEPTAAKLTPSDALYGQILLKSSSPSPSGLCLDPDGHRLWIESS